MTIYEAPGLTADWLNGWLAAVGVTVLLPEVRLAWSNEASPIARFEGPGVDGLPAKIAAALPSPEQIGALAIRLDGPGGTLSQKAKRVVYSARAAESRRTGDWSLGVAHTDLAYGKYSQSDDVERGPFHAGREGRATLWKGVIDSAVSIQSNDVCAIVELTLAGRGRRVEGAGLAFDCRRLPSSPQVQGPRVVPVVELLGFLGLSLFPVRGDGRNVRQRGWSSEGRSFQYPVWSQFIGAYGIDALIDAADAAAPDRRLALGVTRHYRTKAYEAAGSETSTAYFSELVR